MKNISTLFRDTRDRLGLSQAEFAKLLKVSRVSVSLYETGKATPGSDKLLEVMRLNNVSLDNK